MASEMVVIGTGSEDWGPINLEHVVSKACKKVWGRRSVVSAFVKADDRAIGTTRQISLRLADERAKSALKAEGATIGLGIVPSIFFSDWQYQFNYVIVARRGSQREQAATMDLSLPPGFNGRRNTPSRGNDRGEVWLNRNTLSAVLQREYESEPQRLHQLQLFGPFSTLSLGHPTDQGILVATLTPVLRRLC